MSSSRVPKRLRCEASSITPGLSGTGLVDLGVSDSSRFSMALTLTKGVGQRGIACCSYAFCRLRATKYVAAFPGSSFGASDLQCAGCMTQIFPKCPVCCGRRQKIPQNEPGAIVLLGKGRTGSLSTTKLSQSGGEKIHQHAHAIRHMAVARQ